MRAHMPCNAHPVNRLSALEDEPAAKRARLVGAAAPPPPPPLPVDVLRRIFHTGFTSRWTDEGRPSAGNLSERMDTLMRCASVCKAWADAAIDRELWLALGMVSDKLLRGNLPDPVNLGDRWNALFDSFATPIEFLSWRMHDAFDFLHRCVASKLGRFMLDLGQFDVDCREETASLWNSLSAQIRRSCRALFLTGPLDNAVEHALHAPCDNGRAPSIALYDMLLAGCWPALETVGLETLWGGFTSKTPHTTLHRVVYARNQVYFPKLTTIGLRTNPQHVDVDLLLSLAPRLQTVYVSDVRALAPMRRCPFLFGEQEFRLFWHADFLHIHRLPGPSSGAQLRVEWSRWLQMCAEVNLSDTRLCAASLKNGAVRVQERVAGEVRERLLDVAELFDIDDLSTLFET